MVRYFGTPIQLSADPAASMQATTKQYTDAAALDAFRSNPYPIDQYGLIASTIHPDNIGVTTFTLTAGTMELYRIYVPANKVITGAATYVSSAGTIPGSSNASGWALYTDDGTTQVTKTANDYTIFTSTGWRSKAFPSQIAAQSVGRFVRLAMVSTCSSTAPSLLWGTNQGGASFFNGIVPSGTHRRGITIGSITAFPTSFTPSTYGSNDSPMVFMGLY
jgi:hypothetical protein